MGCSTAADLPARDQLRAPLAACLRAWDEVPQADVALARRRYKACLRAGHMCPADNVTAPLPAVPRATRCSAPARDHCRRARSCVFVLRDLMREHPLLATLPCLVVHDHSAYKGRWTCAVCSNRFSGHAAVAHCSVWQLGCVPQAPLSCKPSALTLVSCMTRTHLRHLPASALGDVSAGLGMHLSGLSRRLAGVAAYHLCHFPPAKPPARTHAPVVTQVWVMLTEGERGNLRLLLPRRSPRATPVPQRRRQSCAGDAARADHPGSNVRHHAWRGWLVAVCRHLATGLAPLIAFRFIAAADTVDTTSHVVMAHCMMGVVTDASGRHNAQHTETCLEGCTSWLE